MDDELDLSDAADYIRAESPDLGEDEVWGVLGELRTPPDRRAEALALDLLASVRPDIPRRAAKRVIREWRAYASLAREPDWEDD